MLLPTWCHIMYNHNLNRGRRMKVIRKTNDEEGVTDIYSLIIDFIS